MSKLGLIAGNGSLPDRIIESCLAKNQPIFVISITDEQPKLINKTLNIKLNIASVGKAIKFLKNNDVKDIIFAGGLSRPKLKELRPDATGIRLLSKITKAKFNGDNQLLSTIVNFFEGEGFNALGADEVLQDLVTPQGILGTVKPSKAQMCDVEMGIKIAQSIGNLDIGQSIIVQDNTVIGVEAIEGTDNLMIRCKNLQFNNKGGILVKVKKPNQDRRIDLPTIGINTIITAFDNNLSGIVIESGNSIILDKQTLVETANDNNIFIFGF
jgi:hypothetical protein